MNRFQVTTPPTEIQDTNESSMLSLFDKNNPDKNLFNLIDDEIIKLSGSEILVYKYERSDDHDDVYMEARNKPIRTEPIRIFGNYDPRPLEENLNQFGLEIQNEQIFIFNKNYLERVLGRAIIPGDILKPVFQNMKFEVYQVQEDSFESYGIYHITAYAKFLRDSETIHNETIDTDRTGRGTIA